MSTYSSFITLLHYSVHLSLSCELYASPMNMYIFIDILLNLFDHMASITIIYYVLFYKIVFSNNSIIKILKTYLVSIRDL